VLAPALRRHVGHRAFEHLQEGLLHAFAGDVAGDGDVLGGLADLVDLVDVDDAPLGGFEVEVGGVQELQQQVLHVLAHVAGLGERGRVADGKGDVDDLGQGLRQERLAGAGRSQQEDVRLVEDDLGELALVGQAFVVVVDGHGEDLLGVVLADDVLVELAHDLARRRDLEERLAPGAAAAPLLIENGLAQIDALAADIDVARPFDQRSYVAIALSAEGTEGVFLSGSRAAASRVEVPSCWHASSFKGLTCRSGPWPGQANEVAGGVARKAGAVDGPRRPRSHPEEMTCRSLSCSNGT